MANRAALKGVLPSQPLWLNQVHGTKVSTPQDRLLTGGSAIEADAAVTNLPNEVLVILSADCLPVLLTSAGGQVIGVAHAGWRGLCKGVLENTVQSMLSLDVSLSPADISVWLGPAIGPNAFEVGEDVVEAFQKQSKSLPEEAFRLIPNASGKYLANLYLLARERLKQMGVNRIEGGTFCTYSDPKHFFSYRRDGQTGRFASFLWRD